MSDEITSQVPSILANAIPANPTIDKIKPPRLLKFRVVSLGPYIAGNRIYRGPRPGNPFGDVVESMVDLCRAFPNKFERVSDDVPSERELANINELRLKIGELPITREAPPAPVPTAPVGINVTDKFAILLPNPGSHFIFKSEGLYFVWNMTKGKDPILVNKIGVNKGQIEDVLKGDVPVASVAPATPAAVQPMQTVRGNVISVKPLPQNADGTPKKGPQVF